MITAQVLMQVTGSLDLLLLGCDAKTASEAASGWTAAGLVVRVVRGRKMRTLPRLFDEFAAALQFPWYFGENRDAFDECIADLGWLPTQCGYVIVVTEAGEVLGDEAGTDALAWLVGSLSRAAEEWARPVELGEWWDRPAVPFHVVLQATAPDVPTAVDRWAATGATIPAVHGSSG